MLDLVNIKDYFLLIFFFTYAVLLPGYLLVRVILPPRQLNLLTSYLPGFEQNVIQRYFYFLFAPAAGLILLDAAVLVLAKVGLALNFNNYFYSFAVINLVLLILNYSFVKPHKVETPACPSGRQASLQSSKRERFYLIFSLIFLLSLLIRIIFYLPDVVPQDTDLGHHMYWSQLFVQQESFPAYDSSEVIEGEHMVFAVLSKLSGIGLLSSLPLIILAAYNLFMILGLSFSMMVLTGSRKIALWTLFFTGIYFAVDPPQARYVKGGVIGNTFGNLFIALVFLLVFLFFRWFFDDLRRSRTLSCSYKGIASLVSIVMIIIAGLFYTHHLSAFLLGITLTASFIFWIIATLVPAQSALKRLLVFFKSTLLSKKFILTLLTIAIFPLFIYLPHYLANSAVDTVAQAPIKDTHLGVPLTNLPGKIGWLRLIFLAAGIGEGILLIYWSLINAKIASTKLLSILLIFFGWLLPLAILSFAPQLLKIDLPSQRVLNYLIFPSALLAAIGADNLWIWLRKYSRSRKIAALALIIGLLMLWEGTGDFRGAYKNENKFQDAVELYGASRYLASHTDYDTQILKDHRTITGDSWIKFFFLRGYDYLISRTYDYKYNAIDSKLDPCTREMILVPNSSLSERCYGQTGINYVIVKPDGDEYLFWKGSDFNPIYLSDSIAIFQKVKN